MNDQHWGPSISAHIGGTPHAETSAVVRKQTWLKATLLPWFYWNGMLKGREWLTRLSRVD